MGSSSRSPFPPPPRSGFGSTCWFGAEVFYLLPTADAGAFSGSDAASRKWPGLAGEQVPPSDSSRYGPGFLALPCMSPCFTDHQPPCARSPVLLSVRRRLPAATGPILAGFGAFFDGAHRCQQCRETSIAPKAGGPQEHRQRREG